MSPIGIGVIGCGMMGTIFAEILSQEPLVHLVGVSDIDPVACKALAHRFKTRAFEDYRELLDVDGIDAVIVATSDQNHRDPCVEAASRRKHFMVEKPLATTEEDARAIVDAVDRSGVVAMVGHTLRFDPRYVIAYDAIRSGRVGKPAHIYARRSGPVTPIGRRLRGRTSVAFFLGSHDIDVMHWFTGARVQTVYSLATRNLLQDLGVDDTIIALLEFNNGTIATLEVSWALPDCPGPRVAPSFEVFGTRGMVRILAYEQGLALYSEDGVETPNLIYESQVYGRKFGIYTAEIKHFIDCVVTHTKPVVSVDEGLRAVEVVCAIHRSLERHDKVHL